MNVKPNNQEQSRTDVAETMNALVRAIEPLLPRVVANLAPGATDDDLAAVARLPVHDTLLALWRLHHGQREEMDGLFEHLDFLATEESARDTHRCERRIAAALEREPHARIPLVGDDLRFVSFAERDHEHLLIHAGTGAVFYFIDNYDFPTPVAYSLPSFLDHMARDLAAGDYTVEEGFGEGHLAHTRSLRGRWVEVEAEPRVEARPTTTDAEPVPFDVTVMRIRAIEAKALAKLGLPIERIAESMDLPVETVRELLT